MSAPDRCSHYYRYYNDTREKKEPEKIAGSEAELSQVESVDLSQIPDDIQSQIREKVAELKKIAPEKVRGDSRLILDLYFDSLDLAEMKSFVASRFTHASNPPITALRTVGDLCSMAVGKSRETARLKECEWIESVTGGQGESVAGEKGIEKTPVLRISPGRKGTSKASFFKGGGMTIGSDGGFSGGMKLFRPHLLRDSISSGQIKQSPDTLLTLWQKNFSTHPNDSFVWDDILGMQSRRDFSLKAYLIADILRKIPGEKIAIMLPSVSSASLLILASHLARKTPVMFNWTLPRDAFRHCVEVSGVETILSSSSFYEKVKNETLEEYAPVAPFIKGGKSSGAKEGGFSEGRKQQTPQPPLTGGLPHQTAHFLFLEHLLSDISSFQKIRAWLSSRLMQIPRGGKTSALSGTSFQKETPAVILFTSGSESLPKAVALTHTNIIENLRGALDIFQLRDDDILLGFLPPFHSFGFTVNTILPLISGMRVVYTPDPTDAQTILSIIRHTRVTALTATPTFLRMILSLARPGDLDSLRYAVVGAERCPTEVFERFAQLCPSGRILEGYGITECSPVVAINPIDTAKPGTVGRVLPHLECRVVDIDTRVEKKRGEQGMILVSGSSIFSGYLDASIESPFVEMDQTPYYQTGDLGFLDADGFLTITGRLKRFIKIAGEMISLPFVEGMLLEKYGSDETITLALEARESDGAVKIVLFSTHPIDLEEAHAHMRSRGVPNLVAISENIVLSEIPLLGTGKVDYRGLKGRI